MIRLGVSVLVCMAFQAAPAIAQEDRALSGPEIAQMIAGNTVEGTMAAGGPYREFYLPDGTLRGSNYDGRWSVVADTLCFTYDATTPAQCWSARISRADEISWIRNGIVDGNGVVQPGNPANF